MHQEYAARRPLFPATPFNLMSVKLHQKPVALRYSAYIFCVYGKNDYKQIIVTLLLTVTLIIFFKRCLGIRFLYPVYCIAEVEITLPNQTNQDSIQKGMLLCHSVVLGIS